MKRKVKQRSRPVITRKTQLWVPIFYPAIAAQIEQEVGIRMDPFEAMCFSVGFYLASQEKGASESLAQMLANIRPQAIKVRRKKKDERYEKIRAEFDRAAMAGEEKTVEQIAAECGVSRATAYRALEEKPD